jgi:hypothetical protein
LLEGVSADGMVKGYPAMTLELVDRALAFCGEPGLGSTLIVPMENAWLRRSRGIDRTTPV